MNILTNSYSVLFNKPNGVHGNFEKEIAGTIILEAGAKAKERLRFSIVRLAKQYLSGNGIFFSCDLMFEIDSGLLEKNKFEVHMKEPGQNQRHKNFFTVTLVRGIISMRDQGEK